MRFNLNQKELELIHMAIDALIVKRLMAASRSPANQDGDEMAAIVRLRDRLTIPPR